MDNVSDLAEHRRKKMVRDQIARQKVCPYTGEPLDPEHVILALGRDGKPRMAISPEGWKAMHPAMEAYLANQGVTFDFGEEEP